MHGSSKKGFTLIEVLVVIAIIGFMAAVVVPSFKNLLPRRARQEFVGRLNSLIRFAWQRAIIERKIEQIEFDFKKNSITVSDVVGFEADGKPKTVPVKGVALHAAVAIPRHIDIRQFIIEGVDEKNRALGSSTVYASYFFIVPDGLTQSVTINFIDKKQLNAAGKPRQFGLVLNPFTARFRLYNEFQK